MLVRGKSVVAAAAANAGRQACCNKHGDFQPRLLTQRLQQAQRVQELQQLWQQHSMQFNSIHFSALMQQLSVLHSAAGALSAPPPARFGVDAAAGPAAADKRQQRAQRPRQRAHEHRSRLQMTAGDNPLEAISSSLEVAGTALPEQQQEVGLQAGGADHHQQQEPQQQVEMAEWQQIQQQHLPLLQHGHSFQEASAAPEQQQQQQQDRQQIEQLASAVAAGSLQPGVVQQLDARAIVMTLHSLAKLGVHDRQLVAALLAAVTPQLSLLDSHQITNLIWAAAVHTVAARTDSLQPRARPQQQGASGPGAAAPEAWLPEAAEVLRQRLPGCGGPGVAMALWGLGHLGHCPPQAWWSSFFEATQNQLRHFSSNELAIIIYSCGRLRPEVPAPWLAAYLSASSAVLPGMNSQALTMSVWGLAAAGLAPDKAWLMAWFLTSRAAMQHSSTQDLSLWLYSLAVMKLTPSPVWCTSFVEASFARLTARGTRAQELVNVMWAISRMTWSPPVLYWQGLVDAARAGFSRFNPQDFATCISAVVAVDVACVDKAWLQAFIQASQPRLAAFQPVQLANTGLALASISMAHSWAPLCISATWLAAYVAAASAQLGHGRFSARNLQLVVHSTRALHYLPVPPHVVTFLQQAEAQLQSIRKKQQQQSPSSGGQQARHAEQVM